MCEYFGDDKNNFLISDFGPTCQESWKDTQVNQQWWELKLIKISVFLKILLLMRITQQLFMLHFPLWILSLQANASNGLQCEFLDIKNLQAKKNEVRKKETMQQDNNGV